MKSLTLVLCVIAILGSAASAYFYFEVGNTKEQLQQEVASARNNASQLQNQLTESGAQNEAIRKQLAALDSDLGDAKSKTTAAETRNTQLTRDIAQLRNQLTAKEDAEQSLNREISQLKRELAQAKLASSSASPEEIENYKSTIATLQARVTELESGRGTIAATASVAGMSSVTGSAAAPATAAVGNIRGEVASVGGQNAFVVLNVGSSSGVEAGQRFAISRNGNTLATAQVSTVHPNYAVAHIASGSLRGPLNKGDLATISQ